MAGWRFAYKHPVTGEVQTFESPRPLRTDELVSGAREMYGADAEVVHMDARPSSQRAFREALAKNPNTSGGPLEGYSRQEPADWGPILKEGAIQGVGMVPYARGMQVATRLGRMMPWLDPSIAGVGGMTTAGANSGVIKSLLRMVTGEDVDPSQEISQETTAGTAGGGLAQLLGPLARHGPGSKVRMGRAMATDIERVGSAQTPVLKGLTTPGQQYEFAHSNMGQRAMNELYEVPKQAIMAELPPEVATKTALQAAMSGPTGRAATEWTQRATRIAQQLGGPVDDPQVTQYIERLIGPRPQMPGLRVPSLSNKPLSFEEALDLLHTKGTAFGAPDKAAPGVQDAIEAWIAAKDQIPKELARLGVSPQALQAMDDASRQYARAVGWRGVLSEGFLKDRPRLDPRSVQLGMRKGQEEGWLERSMGESQGSPDWEAMKDTLLRGKINPETGRLAIGSADRPGEGPLSRVWGYIRGGPSGEPATNVLMSTPRGPVLNEYIGAPGRMPYEPSTRTKNLMGAGASQKGKLFDLLDKLMGGEPEAPASSR